LRGPLRPVDRAPDALAYRLGTAGERLHYLVGDPLELAGHALRGRAQLGQQEVRDEVEQRHRTGRHGLREQARRLPGPYRLEERDELADRRDDLADRLV